MSLLEVRNVSYRFPDGTYALRNVSLQVSEGEFIVISGKNGSGKTVFLRNLNGLYTPASGEIIINGISVKDNPYRARQSVGLVFQDADSQIVGQTASRDVAFGLENLKIPKAEIKTRIRKALETMDLEDHADQRARTLSGGEKRRLTIAGVVAMNPSIIALDEPFTNLDYPGVLQVLKILVSLKKTGHTIIVVTHDLDKVLAYADRLVLFENGSIAADNRPEEAIHSAISCGVRVQFSGNKEIDIKGMTWLKN
ncbi:MAG: ABC transporter ATP-binding protein [Spirochaetales bacterium]|nr:ABC transporter ATP-binding protein [Spirochaetales bacterium]